MYWKLFFFWGISAKSSIILKKRTVRKLDSVLVSFDINSLARHHQISGFIWLPHVTYINSVGDAVDIFA